MSSANGDSYTSSILMSVLSIYSFLINFWLEQILSRSAKNDILISDNKRENSQSFTIKYNVYCGFFTFL